jgi:hypothetical protein
MHSESRMCKRYATNFRLSHHQTGHVENKSEKSELHQKPTHPHPASYQKPLGASPSGKEKGQSKGLPVQVLHHFMLECIDTVAVLSLIFCQYARIFDVPINLCRECAYP